MTRSVNLPDTVRPFFARVGDGERRLPHCTSTCPSYRPCNAPFETDGVDKCSAHGNAKAPGPGALCMVAVLAADITFGRVRDRKETYDHDNPFVVVNREGAYLRHQPNDLEGRRVPGGAYTFDEDEAQRFPSRASAAWCCGNGDVVQEK